MSLYDLMIRNKNNDKCHLSKKRFDEFAEEESDPEIRCDFCGRFDVPTFFEPDYLGEHVCWKCLIKETKDHPDILHVDGDLSETAPIKPITVEEITHLIDEANKYYTQAHNFSVKMEVLSLQAEQMKKDLNDFQSRWWGLLNRLDGFLHKVKHKVNEE